MSRDEGPATPNRNGTGSKKPIAPRIVGSGQKTIRQITRLEAQGFGTESGDGAEEIFGLAGVSHVEPRARKWFRHGRVIAIDGFAHACSFDVDVCALFCRDRRNRKGRPFTAIVGERDDF